MTQPTRVLVLSPIPEEGAGCRFRIAQFIGTMQGFKQRGPVADALLRRFYYPNGLGAKSRAIPNGSAAGKATMPSANPELAATLIGSSPVMRRLKERIQQVARTDETVLIFGESGTGKELVARAIHAVSARHAMPFVAVFM